MTSLYFYILQASFITTFWEFSQLAPCPNNKRNQTHLDVHQSKFSILTFLQSFLSEHFSVPFIHQDLATRGCLWCQVAITAAHLQPVGPGHLKSEFPSPSPVGSTITYRDWPLLALLVDIHKINLVLSNFNSYVVSQKF